MKKLLLLLMICAAPIWAQPKEDIAEVLDSWHRAAANAETEKYFGAMTTDAIFIGTDATEVWNKEQFLAFAKPYFDKGKAWDFKPVTRNIYVNGDTAWFDEILDTWMKLCRGSGVMKKIDGKWMIAHYVLSMTIPNDDVQQVLPIITKNSDVQLQALPKK